MTTLTEFVLSRIAEDEAAARDNDWLAMRYGVDSWGREKFSARVLAQCAALRAVVELHKAWPVLVEKPVEFDPSYGADETFSDQVAMRVSQQIAWLTQEEYRDRFGDEPPAAPMIRAVASIWADHPDFDPAWRLT